MDSIPFYNNEINKATVRLKIAKESGDPVLIKKFENDIYNYNQMLKQYLSSKPAKAPQDK